MAEASASRPRWAIAVIAVSALVLLGAGGWWVVDRRAPDPVLASATDEFAPAEAEAAPATTADATVEPVAMPWTTYGYDPGRTRWNPALTHRPPFEEQWIFRSRNLLEFPPVVADGRMFVAQLKGRFAAVDTATGKVLWQYETGHCSAASAAIDGDTVVAAFMAPYPCPKGEPGIGGFVVAWDVATGAERWRVDLPPVESSPLIIDGVVYVGDWDGVVHALDLATGATVWETRTDAQIVSSASWIEPELAPGGRAAIAIGTNGGSVYALDAATGEERWRGEGQEYFYATPTVAYGRVYAANTDGWVYAYGAKSGRLLWRQQAGTYVYTAPVAAENVIYVGTYDGYIVAFDAGTGAELWRADAPGAVHGAPTLMAGLLYFSTCKGCGQNGVRAAKTGDSGTYAMDIATREIVWRFDDGQYSPVVADERLVYLVGKGVVRGMLPATAP